MQLSAGEAEDAAAGQQADRQAYHRTAVALFDDVLDAAGALRALERGPGSPEQVSLLVRAREIDPAEAEDRRGAVARSLIATALETVGGWLLGLASLIVPDGGTYLVAGPLGTALTGPTLSTARDRLAPVLIGADSTAVASDSVRRTLEDFGLAADEATYVERRLAAGTVLIAVTSDDPDQLLGARQLFSDHDAVHISQGQPVSPLAAAATAALAEIVGSAGDADEPALPPLRRHCRESGTDAVCGVALIDRFGDEVGMIDELYVEEMGDPEGIEPTTRYVIVEFGGVLGLGRQHVAVPAALIDLSVQPAHVAVERAVLHRAPRFAGEGSLTRRGQVTICAYFGLTPYWLEVEESRSRGVEE